MCGRAAQTLRPEDIGARVNVQQINDNQGYRPSYNVTVHCQQPTIVTINHSRVIYTMRWGGIGPDPNYDLINIRCDTLVKNGYYKNLFRKNRCLVTAEGYYEWHRDLKNPSTTPLPYFFYMPADTYNFSNSSTTPDTTTKQKSMILMAAIYEIKKSKFTGQDEYRYSIITTDAYKDIGHVHDRMPLILTDKTVIDKYLDKNENFEEVYSMLLKGYTKNLSFHRVATLVNNIKNNSEDLIKPMKEYYSTNGIDRFFQPATQSNSTSTNSTSNSQTSTTTDTSNVNRIIPKSFTEAPQSPSKLPLQSLKISKKKSATTTTTTTTKTSNNPISNYFQPVSKQPSDIDLTLLSPVLPTPNNNNNHTNNNNSNIRTTTPVVLQPPTSPNKRKFDQVDIQSSNSNKGRIIVLTNDISVDNDETESLTIPCENSVDLTDVDFEDSFENTNNNLEFQFKSTIIKSSSITPSRTTSVSAQPNHQTSTLESSAISPISKYPSEIPSQTSPTKLLKSNNTTENSEFIEIPDSLQFDENDDENVYQQPTNTKFRNYSQEIEDEEEEEEEFENTLKYAIY
ncbi:hypothetical protein DLAC_00745 [Tieghemostelium lacteum]|uniref:DUF159-domain-containing protein n=1 Tax=Tieghemostelium lacteum TaxID=361077 RepID=A0A152A753_TIELA|nr:hypothetical protein DLAC_00745 [Tieghemostelium lacteum]|eukprot:KYR01955.1 hypothetical protein DLAC_00745 [Tieghemostelium lacteum]